MSFEISPDNLRRAAGVLAALPAEIDGAPHLGAGPVAEKLKGSAVGASLGKSDPSSRRAKDVLKARYNQFASLLVLSADTFHGTDLDAANRIAAVSDINSGAAAGK